MPNRIPTRRASILLMLLGIITVTLVIAFAFLRAMQMSRGTTLVQRKDDLARLAAEMGVQHAVAVCVHEYGMASEVRDDVTVPPVSRFDSPSAVAFSPLSRRSTTSFNQHFPQPYDLAPDVAFQNLFHFFMGAGGRTAGYANGTIWKPGFARFFEANRFKYDASGVYDPSTYDLYTAATPNPAAVKTAFPPVDPFVRDAAITRSHPSDNPLLLDAQCRPVTDASDARFRLRYAVDIIDMSAALWLNTDMPWLGAAQKSQARTAYKEAFYAVGTQLALNYVRGDSFENVFLGHGAYANSRFVNGQARDWPERGGGPMWFRDPTTTSGRAFHCVHGSPFMNWNDPGGNWIGSALPSFDDLGFALQPPGYNWHNAGETKDNEARVRGDMIAQFAATPFGRPYEAATDHPWVLNALVISPRILEAMVAAYMPPAVRAVAVTSETCQPYIKSVDALGNASFNYAINTVAGIANPITWTIPPEANLTVSGSGPDLFTDAYTPGGSIPFTHPTPPLRDYWTTPVGSAMAPTTWRPDHTQPTDARANVDRYPGERFFSDPVIEQAGQSLTRWRWIRPDGSACNGVATSPRQVATDLAQDTGYAAPAWSSGTVYAVGALVSNGGIKYMCTTAHTAAATTQPGVGATWTSRWSAATAAFTPTPGVDHLGRHIIFYKPDAGGTAPTSNTNAKYLTAAYAVAGNVNWASEFDPIGPFGPSVGGAGTDGRISPYKGSSSAFYTPAPATAVNGEVYPAASWTTTAAQVTAATTAPALRGPLGVVTPSGWKITRNAGAWGVPGKATFPNSYYNRLALAFWHSICVAQVATLAWANHQDTRSQALYNPTFSKVGVLYTATPDLVTSASYVRKGKVAFKNALDPKASDQWTPAAADYVTVEQLDRQFLANLGESFTQPGRVTPADIVAVLPPRYTKYQGMSADGTPTNFHNADNMIVAEYRVTNNIRTLLTPIDTTTGAILTPSSTDPQVGLNVPPNKLWLLDEWNLGADGGYAPGSAVGAQPTVVARARAKMMERVLNDWRLSFFGSSKSYSATFRPKDFDGDGKVFCSGYVIGGAADPDCGLTCWRSADGSGNGPGSATGELVIFSVTGCFAIPRTHQYKIHVRGELYDNFLDRAVSEQYLESALLVDPDANVTRGGLPTGLSDSVIIEQRPIHNYYRGYLNRAYP